MGAESFSKAERLTSRKIIEQLFREGRSLFKHPVKLMFLRMDDPSQSAGVKVAISVPRRLHRRAVDRNLLKRRMREAYRKNKILLDGDFPVITGSLVCMYIYVGRDKSEYGVIERAIIHLNREIRKILHLRNDEQGK